MNPAFQVAQQTANNFAQSFKNTQENNVIEGILSQAMESGDPAVLQSSIGKILSGVSPERQGPAIQYLQNAYQNVEKRRLEAQGRGAAKEGGYTYGAPPQVAAAQVKESAKAKRLSQYGIGGDQQNAGQIPQATQQTGQQDVSGAPQQPAQVLTQPEGKTQSAFRKLSDDQLILASGAPDREVSEPARLELNRRNEEKALKQKTEDRKIKFGQDIGKKVLEKADAIAETLPIKQSALNLMNDAIVGKNLEFFSLDNLAEITGIEGFRSKEGAIFKTAGKEYFLGSISRAGARPNQWIEQQISDMMTKVGRSTEANLSVSRAMQNELDLQKEQVRLTEEIADEIDSQDGNYRKIGSMVNERLSKFSEDKQKELFNDLRAIDAVAKNKPVVFQKVLSGTPLSDYVIEGLLINNNNDPVKSMQAAENLGYKVE